MTDIEQKKVFKKNLNGMLRKHKKQQIEVAKAIGVSQQTFNTWCRGVALPRIGKIEALAKYFGCTKSELIDPEPTVVTISASDYKVMTSEETMFLNLFNSLSDGDKYKTIVFMNNLTRKKKEVASFDSRIL